MCLLGGWSDQVVDSGDASGGESLDETHSETSHEASYLTTPIVQRSKDIGFKAQHMVIDMLVRCRSYFDSHGKF